MNTRNTILFSLLPLLVACSSADRSTEDATSTSEGALTSSVRLEESHIEVWVDQKFSSEPCTIASTRFRLVYENPTLPAGTTIVAHVGETSPDQQFIGDGYGWGPYYQRSWTNVSDLPMDARRQHFELELDGHAFGEMHAGYDSGYLDWQPRPHSAEIQFVFRLELPNGKVLWDNRLNQDYSATGLGPCANGSRPGFQQVATWGPFP